MINTDALIIGAGPTGLFTAHQLKLIGLVYDDGASARYDYEYGRHYAKDKIK